MKALVTGASGFMGTALVQRLRDKKWNVTGLSSKDADLRDCRSLDRFAGERYDRIFHLAAWTQAGDFCLYHPGEQWLFNQLINTNMLTWWAHHQPQAKLISMGTSCSYEEGRDLREENYLKGTPIRDLFTYAMTKRMLLVGQRSLHEQFALTYLTVVPSTLYGPGYQWAGKQAHFIFDLARKILDFKYRGSRIVLWGDGHQRRELVYVDDFVSTLLALDEIVENDIVNIGAGEDHTISEFASLICEVAGVDPSVIEYDPSRYIGAKSKFLNVEKLQELLPNLPRISLREGLKRTLDWMENIYREGC